MKVITCASYGASGSSALTDLIGEYNSVKRMTNYEFRFLHDPDGISDLEFQLVECHNRHNAGRALKRFWRLSQFNAGTWFHQKYTPFFGERNYLLLTKEYVDRLIDFKNREWWFYDLLDKGEKYYYRKKMEDKILHLISCGRKGILENEETYFSHPSEEKFLFETRRYVSALLNAANTEKKPFIEIDQIVASQNIDRYLRYFSEDIEVYVVDRDPRDIYLLEKIYYNRKRKDSVEMFCRKFLYVRKSGDKSKSQSKNIHFIRFEDLIFEYEKMLSEIEAQTGLKAKDHVCQFSLFNPRRSVHNTQIWKDHPEMSRDIDYIEKKLIDYLYPFDQYKDVLVPGISVNDNVRF